MVKSKQNRQSTSPWRTGQSAGSPLQCRAVTPRGLHHGVVQGTPGRRWTVEQGCLMLAAMEQPVQQYFHWHILSKHQACQRVIFPWGLQPSAPPKLAAFWTCSLGSSHSGPALPRWAVEHPGVLDPMSPFLVYPFVLIHKIPSFTIWCSISGVTFNKFNHQLIQKV